MVFELPAGGTTTNEANILTKIPNALNALRDGSSNHYAGSTGNAVGGTANAITLTTDSGSPVHTAYGDGHAITIRPGSTNTSGATIALDGLVAKAILKREAGALVALVAGDIVLNIEAQLLFSTQSDAWILESNPKVALLNAPNLHTADIGVKNTAGTVQRRTHLDPRAGNENQIWDGTNIWHNGTTWKFDDDTKPAYLQIFDMVGNEIAHYHAPANPGFDPTLAKITAFDGTGKMTTGTVPHGRYGIHFFATSANNPTTLTLGSVSVGDLIFIEGVASVTNSLASALTWNVDKFSGTAVVAQETVARQSINALGGVAYNVTASGRLRVTTAGTLVLRSHTASGLTGLTFNDVSAFVLKG